MMIFNKTIPRRTLLRGLGATLALPLLDSMAPAWAARIASTSKPASRLAFFTVPNGIMMDQWTPAAEGSAFDLPPILEQLAPFRDRFAVLSGLDQNEARKFQGEVGGEHPRACTAYLTGVHAKMTSGADMLAGVSVDQIAAKALSKHTQLASLELGLESSDILGTCESAYSCAYYSTISWRTATTPLPMEHRPRAVFERLFGDSDSTDPKERLARIQEQRSILDLVNQDVARLLGELGPADRGKLDQYLDAVRDVERRIQMAEEQSDRKMPSIERPQGVPETFEEHIKLMFDLQVLAFQTDLTRVSTFMVGHEQSNRAYTDIGIGDPHHSVTHHMGDPLKIDKVIRINIFQAQMFRYFLEKLQSTADGEGSLLDHSTIVYGSPFSDGNMHVYKDLPVLLFSKQVRGGRHIRFPEDTPMTNLYLTLLDKMGIPVDNLGDSTGKLELLEV